ncbi:hypothetical protein EVA_14462 [gut metagenome]|uniref:Uncharacterized protein n=1 Tax=gut metagenome TaxID=749906 RepID=J9CBV5_9ZZZZ
MASASLPAPFCSSLVAAFKSSSLCCISSTSLKPSGSSISSCSRLEVAVPIISGILKFFVSASTTTSSSM